jgi:hypothetical protein
VLSPVSLLSANAAVVIVIPTVTTNVNMVAIPIIKEEFISIDNITEL